MNGIGLLCENDVDLIAVLPITSDISYIHNETHAFCVLKKLKSHMSPLQYLDCFTRSRRHT